MTYLPRAMTSPELVFARSDGQSSALYLSILKPVTIYTARINQTFSGLDMVAQITYDTGVGNLADVIPGMTMWIGSTLGAKDVGTCRIRKTPTSAIFYIGEESELTLVDDLYLTVVDEFNLWARHVSIQSEVPYMDYDVAYVDQHTNTLPIPILGPRLVPVWLTGATVVVPFDASLSYTLPDTSIASYLWSAPGSSATSGLTTATPSVTYNAPGSYRVACQITAANGKTQTGYIYVQVYDVDNPPITQFTLKSCTGSSTDNGWKSQITLWDEASLPDVQDRAMVVLFAKDYYGTTEVSLGQVEDRETIISWGWISGSSIIQDPDGSSVEFTVETASAWLKRMSGFPIGIQNITTTSSAWTNWKNLTVDASLYHLLVWQCTAIPVIDVFLTGDTRYSYEQAALGTVFDQIGALLNRTILGSMGCDRLNRLFLEVDTQLTPPAERSAFNTVMSIQGKDWQDQITITRRQVDDTAHVDLSGVAIDISNSPTAFFSLAPGHVYNHWGKTIRLDRVLLSTQALANQLAAMKLAWDNYALGFGLTLASNNRMFDVYPSHQYVDLTVTASDTPVGFEFSGHTIVREMSITWTKSDPQASGWLQTALILECETFPGNSSDGDIPGLSADLSFPPLPDFPSIPNIPPIEIPPTTDNPNQPTIVVLATSQGIIYTVNFNQALPTWSFMNSGLSVLDRADIYQLIKTPSGALYLQTNTGNAVWRCAGLGGTWMQIASASDFVNGIGGIAPNPLLNDTISILGLGAAFNVAGLFKLATGGTLGGGTNATYFRSVKTATVFSVGKWVAFGSHYGIFNTSWVARYTSGGVPDMDQENDTAGGQDAQPRFAQAPAQGDRIVQWSTAGSGGINYITGGGEIPVYDSTFTPAGNPQGLAFAPTGTHAIAGDAGVFSTPYKTTDSGATWTSLAASIPVGMDIWESCGDNNRWIGGGGTALRLTLDQGASYLDKTGNLSSIAPLVDIIGIKYII